MAILIAILVTFGITAIWQLLVTKRIRANHQFMVRGIIKEMDEMAVKLGYRDFLEYLVATKGKEYAIKAGLNLQSFYDSFSDRGVDRGAIRKDKEAEDSEEVRFGYALAALRRAKKDRENK